MVSLEYKTWCLRAGIKVYGIDAGFVEHGWRGVVATEPIQPGQTILEVPEALLMTKRSAMADACIRAALEQHPGLSSVQVLGIHLLRELSICQAQSKQSDSQHQQQQQQQQQHGLNQHKDGVSYDSRQSKWQLYLEHLPRSYSTLCNWSPADIEALQQPHAQEAAGAAVAEARQQWLGALPVLRALGLARKFLGLPAWLWATSTLMSRTMYIPFDSAGALTPFGDLHNYRPPPPPFTPDMFKGLPSTTRHHHHQQQQQQSAGSGAEPRGTTSGSQVLEPQSASDLGASLAHAHNTGPAEVAGGAAKATVQESGAVELGSHWQAEVKMVGEHNQEREGSGTDAASSAGFAATTAGAVVAPAVAVETRSQGPGGAPITALLGLSVEPADSSQRQCSSSSTGGVLQAVQAQAQVQVQQSQASSFDVLQSGSRSGSAAGTGGDRAVEPDLQADVHSLGEQPSSQGASGEVGTGLSGPRAAAEGNGWGERGTEGTSSGAEDSGRGVRGPEGSDARCGRDAECSGRGGRGTAGMQVGEDGGAEARSLDGDDDGDGGDGSGGDGGDGHFDEAAGVYRLVSRQHYEPGDQVFLCYGRHTNLQLLEHYGFMLDDNPHDQVQLPVELLEAQMKHGPAPPSGGAGSGGRPLLGSLLQGSECFLHAGGQPSWALLRTLRTLAEPAAERRRCGHLLAAGERVSFSGDLRAAVWLRGACVQHLAAMPTALSEDEQLLSSWRSGAVESSSPSASGTAGGQGGEAEVAGKPQEHQADDNPRFRLAVEWRACQKRILAKAIRNADDYIAAVSVLVLPDEADCILGRGRYRRPPMHLNVRQRNIGDGHRAF